MARKTDKKYLEQAVRGDLRSPSCIGKKDMRPLRREDAELIAAYIDSKDLKPVTRRTNTSLLVVLARRLPVSFREVSADQLKATVNHLKDEMKPNSVRRVVPLIKNFAKWLKKKHNPALDLEEIRELKAPKLDLTGRTAAMMLNKEEIEALVTHAGREREKAMVAMMYEGSLRPGEICGARWMDLNFDKHGAQFTTSEKTGIPRYIRLIWSAPYLKKWAEVYPGQAEGENPIFTKDKGVGSLSPHRVGVIVKKAAERAGIRKRVFAYLMRHSRISSMMAQEIPSGIIGLQAWGDVASPMLRNYAHVSNAQVDRILLTKEGIVPEERKEEEIALKPKQCPNCGKLPETLVRFCPDCGTPLTENARQTQTTLMGAIDKKVATVSNLSENEQKTLKMLLNKISSE